MPQIEVKEKFAWRPILTTSGKWLWWRHYVKRMKIYWGPAGEDPVIDAEFFTEGEWLLEEIKQPSSQPSPPHGVFSSVRGPRGPRPGY